MQTLDQLTLDKSALAFLSFIGVTRTMAGYIFQDFTLFYEHSKMKLETHDLKLKLTFIFILTLRELGHEPCQLERLHHETLCNAKPSWIYVLNTANAECSHDSNHYACRHQCLFCLL